MTWRMTSPVGSLRLEECDGRLVRLVIERRGEGSAADPRGPKSDLLRRAAEQLEAYFARERQDFDLPLRPAGTDFELAVWRGLAAIPYGATMTYGALARSVGGVARAVGQACGSNPLPIVIPCHRVLAADGSGGFSAPGGVDTKYKLLALEGAALL